MAAKNNKNGMGKAQLCHELAKQTGLSLQNVRDVLDCLLPIVGREVGKEGPGCFTMPGLFRIKATIKPARPAGKRPNPFKPGEMMEVKAKPAETLLRVKTLKTLKDLII